MELSNYQNEKIAMFNKRRDFINVEDNHELLYGNDVVKAKIVAIDAKRVLLDKGVDKKLADSTGEVPQKKLTRDKATKTIMVKSQACAVYFEENNQEDIAKQLNQEKSYYNRQTTEDIETVLKARRKILFDNKTALAGYGVNDDFFTKVDNEINEMAKWLNAPTAAVQSQYAGDAEINKYIGEIDKMQDQLDRLVVNAFDDEEDEDFVSEFLKTGNEVAVGRRHNKVFCSVKGPDGNGINKALIEIIDPATGEVKKKLEMDVEGLKEFNCQNKQWWADASAPGMVKERKLFKPVYRGSFHLDFVLKAE